MPMSLQSSSRQRRNTSERVVWSTWNEERTKDYPQILKYREEWRSFGYELSVTPNSDIRLDVERLARETRHPHLLRVFDSLATTNMQFDFWRFAKLYLDGGVYADVDVRPKIDIIKWQDEAHSSGSVVLFEESPSYMANSTFFHAVRPVFSNYQELPSYASCVVVSPGPRSKFFLDLLLQVRPQQWEQEREPRRTLMTAGPGLLTQFAKQRNDVVLASKHEGTHTYIHTSFGTWKPQQTLLYEKYGMLIPVFCCTLVALGCYHFARGHRRRQMKKCPRDEEDECSSLFDEERGSRSFCDRKDDSNLIRRTSSDSIARTRE